MAARKPLYLNSSGQEQVMSSGNLDTLDVTLMAAGTPTSGQVPVASSGTAASWGRPKTPGTRVFARATFI